MVGLFDVKGIIVFGRLGDERVRMWRRIGDGEIRWD